MAARATSENSIALIKGTTWGTAAALTGAIAVHGRYTLRNSRGVFEPQDVGFGLFVQDTTELEESTEVTFMCDLFYGSHATMIMAMVLGSDVASEVTVDEDDFQHVIDMTSNNDGLFTTMVASYGSGNTEILEFPSVKWTRFKITHATNGVAQFEATGIANRLIVGSHADAVNDLSDLEACTYQDWDDEDDRLCVLGGAGHYFRMNAASGAALSSSNDLEILNYDLEVMRELERDFTLRGALTKYTTEPKQLTKSRGVFNVQLHEVNESAIDVLSLWQAAAKLKAEIYFGGSQINEGVNRSFKIQLPKLKFTGEFPSGYDLPNNNTRMRPQLPLQTLQALAAPAGMTGVTNYIRVTAINEREAQYD